MAADRDFSEFTSNGISFLQNLRIFLISSPMSDYWTVEDTYRSSSTATTHLSRIIVRHDETAAVFNLIQDSLDWQEVLVIHSCADTVYQFSWAEYGTDWWRLNYNVPASVIQLAYPEGSSPTEFLTNAKYYLVGTSQFIFIASKFDIDSVGFSSQGIFGFLDSYDEEQYKIVGGLPTNNFTLHPYDLEHHFWETGFQNFSVRYVDPAGITQHQTTYQAHDYEDFDGDYATNYLLPVIFFEEGTEEYSGRIAGELHDMWRIANDASDFSNGEKFDLGSGKMAFIFKDGEETNVGMAVRYQ